MAKKVRTPEEVQARLEKKAAKRKLFFGTFTKALAFFLAIAMVYSLAIIAFTPATVAPTTGNNVQSGNTSNGFDDYDDGSSNAGTGDAGTNDAGNAGNAGDAGNADKKAEVIKVFNDTTAAAAKGSYKLHREGKFTKDIDVGNATSALDSIIKGVDENASINSVVGGFLGLNKPVDADVKGGKAEGVDEKYFLKAMNLTEADVVSASIDGNKYTVKIKKTITPDANSALAHATNDYITFAEVNKSINEAVGSAVVVEESGSKAIYDNIVFTATVVDGKLTNLEYSYTFSATLAIKLAIIKATGTGEAEITGTYSNIAY